jgi:hypothetical protein
MWADFRPTTKWSLKEMRYEKISLISNLPQRVGPAAWLLL